MLWGWLLVGVLTLIVGLSMAEVCSSFPTAGGLYYWAAKLAPGNSGPAVVVVHRLVQPASARSPSRPASTSAARSRSRRSSPSRGNAASWTSPGHVIAILAVVLFVHGLLNTLGVRLVALLNDVSVWWHLIGVAIIVIVLFIAPHSHSHQSLSFLFASKGFKNLTGFSVAPFVFLIGLLNAQYTFTGYDASAHMTEETINAAVAGPKGIVGSIWVSLIAGFILLLGVSMAIPKGMVNIGGAQVRLHGSRRQLHRLDADLRVLGRQGAGRGADPDRHRRAVLLRHVVGDRQLAHDLRVLARRRHPRLRPSGTRINKRTRTPTNSIWFAAVGAFILSAPYLWNSVAYFAVTSIAVIGLYVAYVMPVLMRRINGSAFKAGPWQLGAWSPILGWIAVVWVVFISVLFCLPQVKNTPFSWSLFNYTPIALAVVIGSTSIWYVVSARKWFKGPKVQGTAEELAAIERDLEAV